MTTTAGSTDRTDPISAAAAMMETVLDGVRESPTWSLDGAECRDLLQQLTRLEARLMELQLRVLHQADVMEVGQESGATSTATWLAHATHQTRREAHRRVRLATALDVHDTTRLAMAAGAALPEQATVVTDAVDALPDDPDLRRRCETHLVDQAADFDAADLRRLGRRVLHVVDPTAGEAHEAALLEAEERDAARATRLTLTRDGHGHVHGRFMISELTAAMLEKALRGIAAPKHVRAEHGAGAYDGERPSAQRLGQAFVEYVERYPVDRLPDAGGVAATVVVTMTLDALTGGLAAALDSGEHISAGQARRLACEAGVVPTVLGTASVVLDQGRRARLHTGAQRLAVATQQQHCQHPTCDTPAAMCHLHHTVPWSRGGRTDLDNAQLLCPRHHRLAHRDLDPPMRT